MRSDRRTDGTRGDRSSLLAPRCSHAFEAGIRSRGLSYFSGGRVRLGPVDENGVLAHVKGSRRAPYQVVLDWGEVEWGDALTVSCDCQDFEDGTLCKHVWATLLTLDDTGEGRWVPGSGRLELVPDYGFDDDLERGRGGGEEETETWRRTRTRGGRGSGGGGRRGPGRLRSVRGRGRREGDRGGGGRSRRRAPAPSALARLRPAPAARGSARTGPGAAALDLGGALGAPRRHSPAQAGVAAPARGGRLRPGEERRRRRPDAPRAARSGSRSTARSPPRAAGW